MRRPGLARHNRASSRAGPCYQDNPGSVGCRTLPSPRPRGRWVFPLGIPIGWIGRLGKGVQGENQGGKGGGASGLSRWCHLGRLTVAPARPAAALRHDGRWCFVSELDDETKANDGRWCAGRTRDGMTGELLAAVISRAGLTVARPSKP